MRLLGIILISVILTVVGSTKVRANESYEEETYEDLVKRLNQKRNQVSQRVQNQYEGNPLDVLTLHGGLGIVASSFYWHQGSRNKSFNMNGFQLSGGIDLFSENLVAEAALRNFGTVTTGDETDSFREFDIKAMYRQPGHGQEMGYRFGMGLGTRYLSVSLPSYSLNEVNPAFLLFGGIETPLSRMAALGIEFGYRSVISASAADQSSVDLMVRLDGFF